MKSLTKLAFAFAAVLILGAVCIHFNLSPLRALALCTFLFGTATVTYLYPVAGTTAPTAASFQAGAQTYSMVNAVVNFGDTDTTAFITTNMNATTTELALGWPIVRWAPQAFGTPSITAAPIISYTCSTVGVTLTKQTGTDTGATWTVWVSRPHSLIK